MKNIEKLAHARGLKIFKLVYVCITYLAKKIQIRQLFIECSLYVLISHPEVILTYVMVVTLQWLMLVCPWASQQLLKTAKKRLSARTDKHGNISTTYYIDALMHS